MSFHLTAAMCAWLGSIRIGLHLAIMGKNKSGEKCWSFFLFYTRHTYYTKCLGFTSLQIHLGNVISVKSGDLKTQESSELTKTSIGENSAQSQDPEGPGCKLSAPITANAVVTLSSGCKPAVTQQLSLGVCHLVVHLVCFKRCSHTCGSVSNKRMWFCFYSMTGTCNKSKDAGICFIWHQRRFYILC